MRHDVLNIDIEKINVAPGIIRFNEYEVLKQQALELAQNIEQVEVTDENIQVSKKMLAAVNKRIKEMEDKRIAIKKEMLAPYEQFEQQVKEIVAIVKDADAIVRNQVKELEEKERDEKRLEISEIFEKRKKHYPFTDTFTFDSFLKPNHLNKSVSIKSVEAEMVDWLEKIDADIQAISTLPNSEEILTEYYDTKDVSVAIRIVTERNKLKEQVSILTKPMREVFKEVYHITIYDEKDVTALEKFMRLNSIKYSIEKVDN